MRSPDNRFRWSPLIVAAACALLVAGVHSLTEARITSVRSEALRDRLTRLAGVERREAIVVGAPWPLVLCGQRTLVRAEARGYGGAIELLVALSPTRGGRIDALDVARHAETPGIGDFISDPEGWLNRFVGVTSAALAARDPTIDAVAGATITVRGVRNALRNALNQTVRFNEQSCGSTGPSSDPRQRSSPGLAPELAPTSALGLTP